MDLLQKVFESDNDANNSSNTPLTSGVFSNITAIGPYRGSSGSTISILYGRGARLRRNTALSIFNSIFMDYGVGLNIEDGSVANANNGILKYKNNIVAFAPPQPAVTNVVAVNDATRAVFFNPANSNDSLPTTDSLLTTPYNFTAPDYRPAAGSPALSNFNFTDSALLPVTLVKFNGQTINSQHMLSWETATEINNTGFHLQRSADGANFSSIGFIPSKALNGNSSINMQYSFTDVKVPDGKLYYRLNQVDKDGKSILSPILVLSKLTSRSLTVPSIYPNPVRDNLSLVIVSPSAQKITVRMNDAFGRVVDQRVMSVSAGTTIYNLNIKSFSAGSYSVNVITDNRNQKPIVKKFLKQ